MTPRRGSILSRALALGLLAAIIGGVGIFGVLPLYESAAASKSRLAKLEAGLEGMTGRIAALRETRAGHSGTGGIAGLWGGNGDEAAALAQAELGRLASERGASLRSVSRLDDRTLFGAPAAAFRVEFEAPLDAAAGLLAAIEGGERLMAVERIALRRPPARVGEAGQPRVFATMEIRAPFAAADPEREG